MYKKERGGEGVIEDREIKLSVVHLSRQNTFTP